MAEYRRDRFDSAISILTGDAGGVMGPAPRLVIAMAEYRKGDPGAARKTLAAEMVAFDWGPEQAGSRDDWIFHVLRREAEMMIIPDLPELLDGGRAPRDHDERFIVLGVYRSQNRTLAAARLCAETLARDPLLAAETRLDLRYKAACAAAAAGFGSGRDATRLDEGERANWRTQALAWLRDELASRKTKLANDSSEDRASLRTTLSRWRSSADLARLREPGSLQPLSDGDREAWATFWREVDHLIGY